MPAHPPRRAAVLAVALFLTMPIAGTAQANWEFWTATLGPRPLYGVTAGMAPLAGGVAAEVGGADFRHPGAFADALLLSADLGPQDPDLGLRVGTFLWNALASGDFWGVDEYQKWPFMAEVREIYDAADHLETCGTPGSVFCGGYPDCDPHLEPSWEDYERDCPHDRVTLAACGAYIILWHAQRCWCLTSPQSVAAFERVVTQGLATEGLQPFLAKALLPDLWVPMLKEVSRSYGLAASGVVGDDAPLLFPSLMTQVLTILRQVGLAKSTASVDPAPGGIRLGEASQQPPPDEPAAEQAEGGAGACRPYVWSDRLPVEAPRAPVSYRQLQTFYFHYGGCASYVKHQFLLNTDVSAPSAATSHKPFPVASFVTTSGSADAAASVVCPDGVTWGCSYRVDATAAFVTDEGGQLSLVGQSRRNLAMINGGYSGTDASEDIPNATFISWSDEELAQRMRWAVTAVCAVIALKLPPISPVTAIAKGACLAHTIFRGQEYLSRIYAGEDGEEATGLLARDSPSLRTFEDVAQVTIHPSDSFCKVLRKPTWWEPRGEYSCSVPLHRRLDIAVVFPEGSGVKHPSILYHSIQRYSLQVHVSDP